jgi:hypothetical protein
MKLLRSKGTLSLVLLQLPFWSLVYGQTVTQQLTSEEIASRVAYVHGNDYVVSNPTLVSAWGSVMTDRIEYQLVAQDENEKFPLLSSVPLMTKANAAVHGADFANFNVSTFNPLVYNLDFFSDRTVVYRIDNTGYLLIVKSIQRN